MSFSRMRESRSYMFDGVLNQAKDWIPAFAGMTKMVLYPLFALCSLPFALGSLLPALCSLLSALPL
jgi:hypothetical protein